MRPLHGLVAVVLIGTVTVGCIGGSTDQPSPPDGSATNNTSNAPEIGQRTYNTTLEWTEARYGTYDNHVVRGSNSVWLMHVPENLELTTIHLQGQWNGSSALQEQRVMNVRVDGPSVDNYWAYFNNVYTPMNVTLDAWNHTVDDDPVYMIVKLHPPRDRTVRVNLHADLQITINYVAGTGDASKMEFR